MLSSVLARVSVSDLLAIACLACAIYGASLLHPAAPWGVAAVALGLVSVEVGKREAAQRQE